MKKVKNNNTILVPTDFSEIAVKARNHAAKLAEFYGNEVTLLHVIQENFMESLIHSDSNKTLIREAVQKKLSEVAAKLKEKYPSLKVNTMMQEGRVYKTIVKVAEEGDYDSIIMGTNGAAGIEKIIGSTASRVIRHSTVPVIVVKKKPIGIGYKKIILPIDLSLETKQKVGWAVHIAKTFNSTIHIIFETEDEEYTKNRILATVAQVSGIIKKAGVDFEIRSLDDEHYPDNFAEDTMQYSDEIDADLIVIMTQQEGGIADYILGDYAQRVVNKTKRVPVMCINPVETGFTFDY